MFVLPRVSSEWYASSPDARHEPCALGIERDVEGTTMWWRSQSIAATVLGLVFWIAAPETRAAVSVALIPSAPTVALGAEFTVTVRVTQAGSAFNAYQAIVRFDPAVLTFLPASPLSLQEGAYMTGACGQTFHWFTSAGSR